MVIFYAGPIVEALLCKWFPLDAKPFKVMNESQPQNGGEPNTDTSGLKFVLVKRKEIVNDIVEVTTNVTKISKKEFTY
jgi:hypothetical protein